MTLVAQTMNFCRESFCPLGCDRSFPFSLGASYFENFACSSFDAPNVCLFAITASIIRSAEF